MDPILIIIIIAILGPVIGAAIGVSKKPSHMFMINMLAFAAGVMLSIAFLELIPESIELSSIWVAIIGITVGALLMYALDKLMPHIDAQSMPKSKEYKLKKTATYLVIGIFMHNFPEGMAMAVGAVSDFKLTLAIAIAIAVHNIPAGICTASPYYYVTKNRLKSFLISASTAIPEVAGFLIAYYIFKAIPLNIVGFIVALTAGLLIYISSDELIPTACAEPENHSTIFSLIVGVLFVILLGLL